MSPSPRAASLWIALVAVAILAGGLAVALRQWRVSVPPLPAVAPSPGALLDTTTADTSPSVVRRALAQIPAVVDSAELKMRWQDEAKGVDVSMLDPRQRQLFVRFANAQRCTCGCGYTLAACRAYDSTCPVSPPILASIIDSLRSGRITSARGLRQPPSRAPLP